MCTSAHVEHHGSKRDKQRDKHSYVHTSSMTRDANITPKLQDQDKVQVEK